MRTISRPPGPSRAPARRAPRSLLAPGRRPGAEPARDRHRRLKLNLAVLRAIRFSAGLHCVHCRGRRIQRWGRAASRQRYRCRDCRRTFNDLTGTPLAYTKRLELWGAYGDTMLAGLSVREAARRVGIHKDTAFRWRHRILAELPRATQPPPRGIVELAEMRVRYSEKGRRSVGRPPRRRGFRPGQRYREGVALVWAVVACDQRGAAATGVGGVGRLSAAALRQWLLPLLGKPCTVLGSAGRFSPYGVACGGCTDVLYQPVGRRSSAMSARSRPVRTASRSHRAETSLPESTGRAAARVRRLYAWMRRFRGVATRYLDHYLRWHLAVDEEPANLAGASAPA